MVSHLCDVIKRHRHHREKIRHCSNKGAVRRKHPVSPPLVEWGGGRSFSHPFSPLSVKEGKGGPFRKGAEPCMSKKTKSLTSDEPSRKLSKATEILSQGIMTEARCREAPGSLSPSNSVAILCECCTTEKPWHRSATTNSHRCLAWHWWWDSPPEHRFPKLRRCMQLHGPARSVDLFALKSQPLGPVSSCKGQNVREIKVSELLW